MEYLVDRVWKWMISSLIQLYQASNTMKFNNNNIFLGQLWHDSNDIWMPFKCLFHIFFDAHSKLHTSHPKSIRFQRKREQTEIFLKLIFVVLNTTYDRMYGTLCEWHKRHTINWHLKFQWRTQSFWQLNESIEKTRAYRTFHA